MSGKSQSERSGVDAGARHHVMLVVRGSTVRVEREMQSLFCVRTWPGGVMCASVRVQLIVVFVLGICK